MILFNSRPVQILIAGVAAISVILFFFLPFRSHSKRSAPFILRVRLENDCREAEVSSDKGMVVYDLTADKVIQEKHGMPFLARIVFMPGGMKINEKMHNTRRLRITPDNGSPISSNGILYPGYVEVMNGGDGLDVVNYVEIEQYLKGVLPKEVNALWPFAALKAQAIASRSYAVYRARHSKKRGYDLTNDTYSQVYGGISAEKWRTNKAVESTQSQVLEYGNEVLPAYFHSCCGGHTENIANVWGLEIAPLKGVKSRWCRWSPYFRWRAKVQTKTILKELNGMGFNVNRIDDIRDGDRDDSGRLKYLRLRSGNKWFEINVNDFRNAIGKNVLKSSNFRVKKYPRFYAFSGYGWGHGVGLCQWGAFSLSLRRWNEKRILGHFYPGAKIVELDEVK